MAGKIRSETYRIVQTLLGVVAYAEEFFKFLHHLLVTIGTITVREGNTGLIRLMRPTVVTFCFVTDAANYFHIECLLARKKTAYPESLLFLCQTSESGCRNRAHRSENSVSV